jgi:hypothetical protein
MPKSSARPARSRGSLHPQRLAGLKRYLRRPPLSCPALNSRRRLRPVQQCRKQEFLGGKHRHGNRLLGWRRWHSQCGLEHVAERPRQAVQFGVDVGERRMPRTRVAGQRGSFVGPGRSTQARRPQAIRFSTTTAAVVGNYRRICSASWRAWTSTGMAGWCQRFIRNCRPASS